jgi:hypothetical protein
MAIVISRLGLVAGDGTKYNAFSARKAIFEFGTIVYFITNWLQTESSVSWKIVECLHKLGLELTHGSIFLRKDNMG